MTLFPGGGILVAGSTKAILKDKKIAGIQQAFVKKRGGGRLLNNCVFNGIKGEVVINKMEKHISPSISNRLFLGGRRVGCPRGCL